MKQLKISATITPRNYPTFDKYLSDINHIALITPEQEAELAEKYQTTGDQQSLDKLICSNLRFVISVAKQYERKGLTLPDLVNEGNLGLIKAAQKFDPSRGFKFISYAVWWIRQSIMQAINEQSRIIRIPQNQTTVASKVEKAALRFIQENQRQATPFEIAEILEISEKEVLDAFANLDKYHLSLNQSLSSDEDSNTLLDVIPGDTDLLADGDTEKEDLRIEILRSLSQLPPRDRTILIKAFGIGQDAETLDSIADEHHLTRERVRQIKDTAISRLRGAIGANLRAFL